MKTEVICTDSFAKVQPFLHGSETPNEIGRFAMQLIEKWGMVAAVDDGEDSAGRHKVRLATPDEVVNRAVETATKAYAAFRENGLMVDMPTYEEMREMAREERAKN